MANALSSQVNTGLTIGRALKLPASFKRVQKILFCGMGGSGISGDILRFLMHERSKLAFEVYRGGVLPKWIDQHTLVILSSYSGNTEEVLAVLKTLKKSVSVLAVTSGGELKQIALKKKLPQLAIPSGLLPRNAVGLFTFSILPVLEKLGKFKIAENEIREIVALLNNPTFVSAEPLRNRMIFIYAPSGLLEPVGLRLRAQLQENAKVLAAGHVFPEMFHNEIEGWSDGGYPRDSAVILLKDKSDSSVLNRKQAFLIELLKKRNVEVVTLQSKGRSSLARLFSLIASVDALSLDLARLRRVDAGPTPLLNAVKQVT